MSALLEAQGIKVMFGGNTAVDSFDLAIESGEWVALIGPNGAGKSTIVNVLAGRIRPKAGRIVFAGEDILGLRAYRRPRLGLVRTYQDLQLFGELTVRENVLAAVESHGECSRRERGGFVAELIAEAGLTDSADEQARVLPYGLRKLTELARALALQPRLLLLDEPAAGLDGAEKLEFVQVLKRALGDRGTALLLVEHDMPTVQALSKHVKVLDAGRLIAEGTFNEISSNPKVIEAYLGR